MTTPPRKPSFTESIRSEEASTMGSGSGGSGGGGGGDNPFLDGIDQMSPQELADYLYALAEEIIASPQEYKVKMGLEQLDIAELDHIDLSTPAGRRKLAKLLRMLAEQVMTRGKEAYLGSVKDSSKDQGRGR